MLDSFFKDTSLMTKISNSSSTICHERAFFWPFGLVRYKVIQFFYSLVKFTFSTLGKYSAGYQQFANPHFTSKILLRLDVLAMNNYWTFLLHSWAYHSTHSSTKFQNGIWKGAGMTWPFCVMKLQQCSLLLVWLKNRQNNIWVMR